MDGALAVPEVQEALRNVLAAGEEIGRWFGSIGQYAGEAKAKGAPQACAAFDWVPFDIIGNRYHIRGRPRVGPG